MALDTAQQKLDTLQQKLDSLETTAILLQQDINNEPDKDRELAKREQLSTLNTRITALENHITELQKEKNILLVQSRGNFLFLRVEFYVLLEFVYFMWLLILITLDIINF